MDGGIVVVDFGGQYAHLIANRVRRLHVYSEIRSPMADPADLAGADGLILSGGPSSVYAADAPPYDPALFELGKPVLGLCYGHQLISQRFGGAVRRGTTWEFGAARLQVQQSSGVLAGLAARELVWMSHRDAVVQPPPGFSVLASTEDCPVAAMADPKRRVFGLQFHPEVTHTASGMRILDNFVALCGCARTWTMEQYLQQSMVQIAARTAGRRVFLLVSGGVDSSVAFVMLNQALGEDRVLGLHIDNGFMRKGETKRVEHLMRECGFRNLHVVDASDDFLRAVEGVTDPEVKRTRIGEEFLAVRERALHTLHLDPQDWLLGQGTLYTDTIESGGTAHAAVIKTHHNRVGVVEQLLREGRVVEPLAQLYKDEVRELGEKLGLPERAVWRHPFPGPGLAVRALCATGEDRPASLPALEEQARQVAARQGMELDVLPLRSVGVQGDSRTYAHPAVVSGPEDWEQLEAVSTLLTNGFEEINRVVYLLGPQPRPAQRVLAASLTRQRLDLLREADAIVMAALDEFSLMREVTQMPTVLLPVSSDGRRESLVLRPISTSDFMTARFSALPWAFVHAVRDRLLALDGIEAVFYDITHKPPGTVEWE